MLEAPPLSKPVPQNLEAERSVLGAVLIEPAALTRVLAAGLRPDHFFRQAHSRIFEAVCGMVQNDVEVDLITLKNELGRRGDLQVVGGIAYLSALVDGIPDVANVEHYGEIVREKAVLRRLIEVGQKVARAAMDDSAPAAEVLEVAERGIFEVAEDQMRTGFTRIGPITDASLEALEKMGENRGTLTGLGTGYEKLDEMTSGLQPSDLIILAARPSMGKTSLCINMAERMAIDDGKKVAVFSLEMSKEQLAMRVLCSQSRINGNLVRTGFLTPDHWSRLVAARQKIADAPLFIDDTAGMGVLEMRAKARRLRAEAKGLDCIMVDYLQLMSEKGRHENRNVEISAISRGLKALAKEMEVPVVALSQLSRAPEKRAGDHRPVLSDLRESGAIEQDADVVAFIYRDEVYHEDTEDKGIAEVIIAKQRNGPVGTFKLVFLNDITRFENLDPAGYR